MLPNDIYHAFIKVGDKHHPAGRFLVHHGRLTHLEDYHNGILSQSIPDGVIDDVTMAKIGRPGNGLRVVSEAGWRAGNHLELIPEAKLDQPLTPQQTAEGQPIAQQTMAAPRPPSVWHYQRVGHDSAHTLEHHGGGKYTLDGNPLRDDELHTILGNIRQKTATLRYKLHGIVDAVAKMERVFSSLRKEEGEEDMDPEAALQHLEQQHAVNPHPTTAKAIKSLRRQVFEDPMIGGIGNKYAWETFQKKNAPGVYMSMDGNNFKSINDTHGHGVGDQAIKAYGKAIKDSASEVGFGKMFRSGGDEFVGHFPTYEHAATFARNLRSKLEQLPLTGGTHKLSLGVGIGSNYGDADKALYEAKKQKNSPTTGSPYGLHEMPSVLAHSLHPGFEGAVPLQHEHLPRIALPENQPSQPTAPSPKIPGQTGPAH